MFSNQLRNHLRRKSSTAKRGLSFQQKTTLSSPSSTKSAGNSGRDASRSLLPLDLVSSSKVKSMLPLIGNGAYLVLVSGFLMTDMLQLRVALVGGYTGLVAFHALHPRPLKIPLRWSALFVVVNAGAACLLALDRWGPSLNDDDEALYLNHFSTFTRGQFSQLLSMGTKHKIPDGTILTKEGKVCQSIYFIQEGQAKVFHHKAFAANVNAGGFVNDVAFQQGEGVGAYGTVTTSGDCTVIVWDQVELRQYLQSRPDMERNMKYTLSEQLMKSLLQQREARHKKQQLELN